jgi:tetratricopeptide (TPR) repeat protein
MVLTKAGLSRLLAEVLPQDADVDAFVAQSFGNIARRVARGTDRMGKISLLIDNAEPRVLFEKISSARAVAVARNEHLLDADKRVAGAPVPDAGPCVGRDALLADLSESVYGYKPEPVLLAGPSGIGKTTLALAVLHASASAAHFGGRRYIAHLDRTSGTAAVVVELSRALGVAPDAPLQTHVLDALRRAPALLVLDDLDVPLGRDPGNLRELLSQITSIPNVSVIATGRATGREPDGFRVLSVEALGDAGARDAFCAVAGEARRSDASLAHALTEAGGNPLALGLLARAAGEGPLDAAIRSWHQKQNELLMRPDGPEQASTIEIAVELILSSAGASSGVHRLVPLVAALPNGIGAEDVGGILPSIGPETAALLVKLGLATNAGGRIRMRRAVAESVGSLHATEEDLVRATYHYTGIALAHGPKIGWPDTEESAARLAADSDNLEAMILGGFDGPHRIAAIDAAVALATFIGSSGHCTPRVIERARDMAREGGDKLGEADCTQALGDIALARGDVDEARARYLDALPLFHQAHAGLSIGACLVRLGDIALARHELDEAKLRFESAVPVYRHIGDKLGEATCLRNLADIATEREDHDEARLRFKEALPIFDELDDKAASALCMKGIADVAFQRTEYAEARALYQELGPMLEELGDRLSMAQCSQNLGDIAFAQGEHASAEAHFQKALPVLKELGDKLGEATCLSTLGDVALACTEIEDAQAYYLAALPLLREVGEKLGEANCIQSLGDIALTQFEHDSARSHYENALGLFAALKDEYSIGWTHYRLAQVAADPGIFKTHLASSREAWGRIGRQDLIDDVNNEFPGVL